MLLDGWRETDLHSIAKCVIKSATTDAGMNSISWRSSSWRGGRYLSRNTWRVSSAGAPFCRAWSGWRVATEFCTRTVSSTAWSLSGGSSNSRGGWIRFVDEMKLSSRIKSPGLRFEITSYWLSSLFMVFDKLKKKWLIFL